MVLFALFYVEAYMTDCNYLEEYGLDMGSNGASFSSKCRFLVRYANFIGYLQLLTNIRKISGSVFLSYLLLVFRKIPRIGY